jgi:N-acetylglutamate synthase-like GNAT family acetyltransferase
MTAVDFHVRRATESDQPEITALVRGARLNPRNIHWERFVVAEHNGRLVGAAQVRQYADGVRELASLVVHPPVRRAGVGTAMVDALLAGDDQPTYAIVDRRYAPHYARWGFAPVSPGALPRSVARVYRIGRIVTAVGSALLSERIRLIPLHRPGRA